MKKNFIIAVALSFWLYSPPTASALILFGSSPTNILWSVTLTNFFTVPGDSISFIASGRNWTTPGAPSDIDAELDANSFFDACVSSSNSYCLANGNGHTWTLTGSMQWDGTNLYSGTQLASGDPSNLYSSEFFTITNAAIGTNVFTIFYTDYTNSFTLDSASIIASRASTNSATPSTAQSAFVIPGTVSANGNPGSSPTAVNGANIEAGTVNSNAFDSGTMAWLNALASSTFPDITDSSGNVGIGNSSPEYSLDVNGDLNFAGNLLFAGGVNDGNAEIDNDGNSWSYSSSYNQYVVFANGGPLFQVYDYYNGGSFDVGDSQSYGEYNGGTVRIDNNGVGIWDVNGGSLFVDNGNVGVGNDTPESTLDVNGSTADLATGDYYLGGNGSQSWVDYYNVVGFGVGMSSPEYELDVNGDTGDSSTGDYQIGRNGDNTYFNAVNGGDVGIGNNSPQYPLDVSGDIGSSASSDEFQIGIIGDPTWFSANGEGGNFGIGTPAPEYQLDVNGEVGDSASGYLEMASAIDLSGNEIVDSTGATTINISSGGLDIETETGHIKLNSDGSGDIACGPDNIMSWDYNANVLIGGGTQSITIAGATGSVTY